MKIENRKPFSGWHPDPRQIENLEYGDGDSLEPFYDEMIPLEADKKLLHKMVEQNPGARDVVISHLQAIKDELPSLWLPGVPWSYAEEIFPINYHEVVGLALDDLLIFRSLDTIFHVLDRFHGGFIRTDYERRFFDDAGILAEFMQIYAPQLKLENKTNENND